MSDSLSPDSNKRMPDEDGPERERTSESGFTHDDLGDPERGTAPSDQSLGGEPGQQTPEHLHQRRRAESGGATPEDSGDAPPEIADDDRSLLTGNPPNTRPM